MYLKREASEYQKGKRWLVLALPFRRPPIAWGSLSPSLVPGGTWPTLGAFVSLGLDPGLVPGCSGVGVGAPLLGWILLGDQKVYELDSPGGARFFEVLPVVRKSLTPQARVGSRAHRVKPWVPLVPFRLTQFKRA